jgi:hypothetical protein
VLADILQGLLHHAQHDGLLAGGEGIAIRVERGADRQPGQRPHLLHGIEDRTVEPELGEQRRAELTDERTDVAELATKQLAQVAQFGTRQCRIRFDDPLEVLDLEDRVRQGLGRAVVDLPSEARPLCLLRLDDNVHPRSSIRIGLHRQTISKTRVGGRPMSISRKHSAHGTPASTSSGQCAWSSPSDRIT